MTPTCGACLGGHSGDHRRGRERDHDHQPELQGADGLERGVRAPRQRLGRRCGCGGRRDRRIPPTSSGGPRRDRRGQGGRDRPGRRRHRRHVPGPVHRDPRRRARWRSTSSRASTRPSGTSSSATRSSSPARTSAPARRARTSPRRCAPPGSAASSRRASRASSTATASTSGCPRSPAPAAAEAAGRLAGPHRHRVGRGRRRRPHVHGAALPPFMLELVEAGGLAPWIRNKREEAS